MVKSGNEIGQHSQHVGSNIQYHSLHHVLVLIGQYSPEELGPIYHHWGVHLLEERG